MENCPEHSKNITALLPQKWNIIEGEEKNVHPSEIYSSPRSIPYASHEKVCFLPLPERTCKQQNIQMSKNNTILFDINRSKVLHGRGAA